MADELGITPGHFRRVEARLEAAGLIERATCENGHRGRLGPGLGSRGPIAGLSLAPLLAGLPRWRAMAEAMAREAAALAEGRALIRIERRAARHAALALAEGHPARATYEAVRGAAFPPSAGYRTAPAIAAHLEALRAVTEEARTAARERQAEESIVTALDAQDEAIVHGAPCAKERRHTEVTTDPPTGSCSAAVCGGRSGPDRSGASQPAEAPCRERGGIDTPRLTGTEPPTADNAPGSTRHEGRDGGEERNETTKPPATSLPPALARRLSPGMLREMACEEMRLYIDHMGTPGRAPTLRDVEHAALMRRRELGITPRAWEEIEAALGWLDALVALVVVDRNRTHPRTPVRNPGGLLRDLARRRQTGTLDLAASVMGVWRREELGGASGMAAAEAP